MAYHKWHNCVGQQSSLNPPSEAIANAKNLSTLLQLGLMRISYSTRHGIAAAESQSLRIAQTLQLVDSFVATTALLPDTFGLVEALNLKLLSSFLSHINTFLSGFKAHMFNGKKVISARNVFLVRHFRGGLVEHRVRLGSTYQQTHTPLWTCSAPVVA